MKRGVVHLALSGSKSILGRVRIVGCREVLREEFARHHAKHRVPDIRSAPYDKIFAWTMTDPQRFEPPLRYEPPLKIHVSAPSTTNVVLYYMDPTLTWKLQHAWELSFSHVTIRSDRMVDPTCSLELCRH